jgi:Leishmanolysin
VVFSGNGQSGPTGAPLPLAPAVRVTDAFGNAVPTVVVSFLVTGGGGSVAGSTAATNPDGVAVLGSWTLGATPGANTLEATVVGTALAPVAFTATGVTLVAGTVQAVRGDNQAVMAGTAVPGGPAVVVRDGSGNPRVGLTVTFAVTAGGGTITVATATTDAAGVAAVGNWTVGTTPGPNRLTATVQGVAITGSPVIFTAVGCSGGGGAGYAVTLCPITAMTPTQRAAFDRAAARWGDLITSDLPNVSAVLPAGSCGDSPEVRFTIDDLVIFASVENIDGPGKILGSAGWCYGRAAGLPFAGLMRFDEADVATLISRGQLDQVILHEMGHVLGIGTLWSDFGLLQLPSTTAVPQDTWYSGINGQAGFSNIGGATYTGGNKVPVENMGGAGTANAHWRESVLANELMTGFLNPGTNPLSELTVRSLADLGYTVNVAGADPFFLALAVRGQEEAPAGALKLGDDIWQGPRFTVDRTGRVTRIR